MTSSTGSVANPWRFAAGYFDGSTGLYKFGTRYYNPGFGRWSQQDPVRGSLADPTSLNRYLYAGDDPVNFTDPSGKAPITEVEWKCIMVTLASFLGELVILAVVVGLLALSGVGLILAALTTILVVAGLFLVLLIIIAVCFASDAFTHT